MHPRLVGPSLTVLLLVALQLVHAPTASAQGTSTARSQGFALQARMVRLFDVNRVACPILARGEICGSEFDHSVSDQANWPKGTPNRHVWSSGLMLAGVVGADGGPWAGDTTAVSFFDLRSAQRNESVELIHATTDADDLARWPEAARIPSAGPGSELFAPALRGRAAASDGDAWFLTWDGNPAATSGRPHPLGVLVETRVMGWRGPQWNNDIIYVAYTIYNVTARDPAVYAGVRPELRDIVAAQGARFQQLNEAEFGVTLPDGGYTLSSLHAGMTQDPMIGSEDHASVAFPFATSLAWQARFDTEGFSWQFRPELHSPPFIAAPGFTGMMVLSAPAGSAELEFFTSYTGSSTGFVPPLTAASALRHMAGVPDPLLDGSCNQPDPAVSRVCWLNTTAGNDATYMLSTPPAALAPGAAHTFVVAFVFAAPVGVPGFTPSAVNVPPGNPRELGDAAAMLDGVNLVDSIAGYRGFTDRDGDGIVTAGEMDLVPGSFYDKVRIAQVLFENGFISPEAPVAPDFYLIPGDDRVTVIWRPSLSEETGDPFFSVARDAVLLDGSPNPLYDPNYRQFDVEGYRIYRGRSGDPAEMELVAQFDYAGTSIIDHAGQVNFDQQCAPELGVTESCSITYDPIAPGVARTTGVEHPLNGRITQVRLGDRFVTTGGLVLAAIADTLSGAGLHDSGVPFAFIDDEVRNNFRYYYAVTAFDVNSWQSGPGSFESAVTPKPITPGRPATNVAYAGTPVIEMVGADGEPLVAGTDWAIDPETGRFIGPPPPTNAFDAFVSAFVAELAPAVELELRIDSVIAMEAREGCDALNGVGFCYLFHVTAESDGAVTRFAIDTPLPVWSSFAEPSTHTQAFPTVAVPADPVQAARYGIPADAVATGLGLSARLSQSIDYSSHEGQSARRGRAGDLVNTSVGGSRWFAGTENTIAHPSVGIRVGHIEGVDTIFAPQPYIDTDLATPLSSSEVGANSGTIQWFGYGFAGLGRQADMRLTWGPGGTVASFEDVTHHVPVMFKDNVQASYGFVQDGNGNGLIDWGDFQYPGHACESWIGLFDVGTGCSTIDDLTPMVASAVITPTSTSFSTDWPETGRGFGLYVAGQAFIFEMPGGALPAAGTVWTLRQYTGRVDAAENEATTSPSGYRYRAPFARSAVVPGLRFRISIPEATALATPTSESLRAVHTVPDPFYLTSGFDAGTGDRAVKFVNLPERAIIRIYSLAGVLVDIIEHHDTALLGSADWDLRNRDGTPVAPGVYFYHIESGPARAVGKFTIVTYEP